MGFDPNRPHTKSPFDYWYVAAGVLVVIALLVWAIFG